MISAFLNRRKEKAAKKEAEEQAIETAENEAARLRLSALDYNIKLSSGKVINLNECRLVLWRSCYSKSLLGGLPPEPVHVGVYISPANELVAVDLLPEDKNIKVRTGWGALFVVRSAFSMEALLQAAPNYPIPAH